MTVRRSIYLGFIFTLFFIASHQLCRNSVAEEPPKTPVFQLEKLNTFNQKALVYVLGDVGQVLDGTVTREKLVRAHLAGIDLGLGLGSFSDEREVGDMMIVGGKAYIKSTNPFRSFKTESQSHLIFSPFSIGLQKDESADAIYRVKCLQEGAGESPCSIDTLYAQLSQAYPQGFAVLGLGTFSYLKGSALKAAPIQGEKITGENASKYIHPSDVFRDKKAAFFGIIVGPDRDAKGFSEDLLGRMFPAASAPGIQSHTHFITSDMEGDLPTPETGAEFLLRVKAAKLAEVFHLLDQSKLKEGILLVYRLEGLEPFTDEAVS